MRYSLLTIALLSRKIQIYQVATSYKTYNIEFIKDFLPGDKFTELPSGIILGKAAIDHPNQPVIFIPESHYMYNLPMMDTKVDYQVFGDDSDNIDRITISLQFTDIVRKELGTKNFNNIIRFIEND